MVVMTRAPFAVALLCVCGLPLPSYAQSATAPRPAQSTASAPSQDLLNVEQLDQLVAPIALYPDNLLAQTLMASTYPLEVVEASRWANENKKLKGDQLQKAVEGQKWDDSVKSLIATPSVLDMMNNQLSWTQKLGDAVLAQQSDVMDAVQRLRARAKGANKLESTKEQKVTVKTEQNKQVIVIEPAQPNTVYVPYYNPSVVYGAWPYPASPPYYYPPAPGYYAGAALATGLAFGAGVALGAAAGRYWGGSVGWGNNNINVNRQVNINNTNVNRSGSWQHDPAHRGGVRYNNQNVANQFGKSNQVRSADRQSVGDRGQRDGRSGDRQGDRAGQRDGAGDRQKGGGDRAGSKQGAGDRAKQGAAGNRQGAGGQRQASAGPRDSAMNVGGGGRAASAQSARGNASLAGGGGGPRGGGMAAGGGGGGMRAAGGGGGGGMRAGGGGGGRGGGGGGRRSDINVKRDIHLLGYLENGLGFYRFRYKDGDQTYVGVMAQDVQRVLPAAVTRDRDGTLRVRYDMLGVRFQTYQQWIASGGKPPMSAH